MRVFNFYMLAAAALFATGLGAQAQKVTVDVEQPYGFYADWFLGSNITYVDGPDAGSPAFGGVGDLLCFNRNRWNPVPGDTHEYELRTTDYFFQGGGVGSGEALVHWLIDNYYHTMVTTSDYDDRSAFHYALWEVAHDYDGTVASLNVYAGGHKFDEPRPDLDFVLADLVANYSLIDSGYRSTRYSLTYLEDLTKHPEYLEFDHVYQSMLLVTPIPEPSSLILLGLAGSAALYLRRRVA